MELDQKHSRLGIASISIFLAGIFIGPVMIMVGAMFSMGAAYGHTQSGYGMGQTLTTGGFILGSCLDLVALGLGIAGLCQKGSKKILAILGTAFSGLIVLIALAWVLFFAVPQHS
jgi:hypothetical protein